jgi:DNA-binding NtrC family response regulator
MDRPLALVVDTDPAVREQIQEVFQGHDVAALGVGCAAETMEVLRSRPVQFVVLDVRAPGVVALDLLRYSSRLQPAPILIPVVSAAEREQAAHLVEAGAFDTLDRPLHEARLRLMVHRALRQFSLVEETRRLREELQSREGYHGIVGRSPGMERLREQLAQLSGSDPRVWLWGELGTGKELVARSLHERSERSAKPFSLVPCAGLGTQNWESRFGVNADGRMVPEGLLARLDGGTLYLEDLPAVTPDLQSRLLTALTHSNLRVLASSTVDPERLVEQGRLVEEAFTPLGATILELAPLRDRVEDIPLLARYFISTICTINLLPPIQLAGEALQLLERHHWPENVQGLRNVLEQAVILCPEGKIRSQDLPDWLRESGSAPSAAPGPAEVSARRPFRDAKREVVDAFERSYLSDLMEHHGGNVTAASQQAGMLRSALQRLLRKYGLKSAAFRRQRQAKTTGESTRH